MDYKPYPTVKGHIFYELYQQMKKHDDIWLLTGDLGWKTFDNHQQDFPDRFINCGISEQAMLGIAVGLALDGKRPFVYSITNFLIYRPFEWIRNYVDHEKLPITLLAGGLGKDYLEDGYTHQCDDIEGVMNLFPNIKQVYPTTIEETPKLLETIVADSSPYFIGMRR